LAEIGGQGGEIVKINQPVVGEIALRPNSPAPKPCGEAGEVVEID